ncbi:hypothetical protein OG21DRAFT_1527788, partial [Imleria badia]
MERYGVQCGPDGRVRARNANPRWIVTLVSDWRYQGVGCGGGQSGRKWWAWTSCGDQSVGVGRGIGDMVGLGSGGVRHCTEGGRTGQIQWLMVRLVSVSVLWAKVRNPASVQLVEVSVLTLDNKAGMDIVRYVRTSADKENMETGGGEIPPVWCCVGLGGVGGVVGVSNVVSSGGEGDGWIVRDGFGLGGSGR